MVLRVAMKHSLHTKKFSIKDFFSKCDQICSKQQIWSHLLKKSLTENFIFCATLKTNIKSMHLQLRTKHSNQGEYKTLLSRLV